MSRRGQAAPKVHQLTDLELDALSAPELRAAYRSLRDAYLELASVHQQHTRAALAALRGEGKKTGGQVPYGYRLAKDGHSLREVAAEQKAIGIARTMRERGLSYRQIATTLSERGMYARGGAVFDPTQIRRMLPKTTT